MTTFDDREHDFEAKFAHDEELRFRVNARRNHMIAEWAIEKAGFADLDHDLFVKEIVNAHIEGGDEVVIRKIFNFLHMAGITITPAQIEFELDHMFVTAKKEVMAE
jgi:hypothetical protein